MINMDYRKKLNKRLGYAIGYIIIGVVLILLQFIGSVGNEISSSFGAAFLVCGAVRVIQYIRLISNKDKMEQREIAEKDERNIMLWEKARSWAFGIYVMLAGTAILVMYMLNMEFVGQIIAYTLCALVFIYWICYMIISRKY